MAPRRRPKSSDGITPVTTAPRSTTSSPSHLDRTPRYLPLLPYTPNFAASAPPEPDKHDFPGQYELNSSRVFEEPLPVSDMATDSPLPIESLAETFDTLHVDATQRITTSRQERLDEQQNGHEKETLLLSVRQYYDLAASGLYKLGPSDTITPASQSVKNDQKNVSDTQNTKELSGFKYGRATTNSSRITDFLDRGGSNNVGVALQKLNSTSQFVEFPSWFYARNPQKYKTCQWFCSRGRTFHGFRRHHLEAHWKWGDCVEEKISAELWRLARHAEGCVGDQSESQDVANWKATYRIMWNVRDDEGIPKPVCQDTNHTIRKIKKKTIVPYIPKGSANNDAVAIQIEPTKRDHVAKNGILPFCITTPADLSLNMDVSGAWNARVSRTESILRQHPHPERVQPMIDERLLTLRRYLQADQDPYVGQETREDRHVQTWGTGNATTYSTGSSFDLVVQNEFNETCPEATSGHAIMSFVDQMEAELMADFDLYVDQNKRVGKQVIPDLSQEHVILDQAFVPDFSRPYNTFLYGTDHNRFQSRDATDTWDDNTISPSITRFSYDTSSSFDPSPRTSLGDLEATLLQVSSQSHLKELPALPGSQPMVWSDQDTCIKTSGCNSCWLEGTTGSPGPAVDD